MSKTKKIAVGVVSIVLASTMCVGLVACGDSTGSSYPTYTLGGSSIDSQDILPVSVEEEDDGSDSYTPTLAYSENTTLNMNTGYAATYGHISYTASQVSTSFYMAGSTYSTNSLKPAWEALSSELGIQYNDVFQENSATAQIADTTNYSNYDMITGQADTIVQYATADPDQYIDLSLYLDLMPNFKAFLEENPLVMLSITSDTYNGAIYYAPYFDGNDDIEKYEIANQHWVEYLLDSDTSGDNTTFTDAVSARASGGSISSDSIKGEVGNGTSTSYSSYMGQTGSWWVETTDVSAADLDENGEPRSGVDTSKTTKVYVNYDAALTAAKSATTALGKAVADTGIAADSLTSGNIVDIQNLVINGTQGRVTGAQLLEILRAYIDVAYLDASGNSFYDTASDVFNGYNAAWDVDLLVAFSRCLITNTSLLNTNTPSSDIYALSARQNTTQRQNDLVSLAGELFGVRGLTSRYQYTYIDSDGTLQDARLDEDMWDALDKMNELVEEGLLYTGTQLSGGNTSYYYTDTSTSTDSTTGESTTRTNNYVTSFMIYDYVQTQTANGGYAKMGLTSSRTSDSLTDYNFAPINTPVSKWDDGDTTDTTNYDYSGTEKYMRFTESWRSVKNTGFCLPYDNYVGQPEKLAAALATIDYMFSNDGQYLMTYGSMSSNNTLTTNSDGSYSTTTDGYWYAEEATGVTLSDVAYQVEGSDQWTISDDYAGEYFVYKNRVYTGTYYNGEQGPTLTSAMMQLYYGNTVTWTTAPSGTNGTVTLSNSGSGTSFTINQANYVTSYTNFARGVIGSALPLCNKLQSFEYQCTADIGIVGADKVAASLVNGTISHVYLQVNNEKNNYWYTIVPTTLPFDSDVSATITANFADHDSNLFSTSSSSTDSLVLDVIRFGLDGTGTCSGYTMTGTTIPTSAAGMISLLNTKYGTLTQYEVYMQNAWTALLTYYNDNF